MYSALMDSRSLRAVPAALALIALPLFVAACGTPRGDAKSSLKSAGGLSESRLPIGWKGDTPAPTGALPRDKGMESPWLARAKKDGHANAKPPTYSDRTSTDLVIVRQARGRQGTSATNASWLARRASVNSRSESRLR